MLPRAGDSSGCYDPAIAFRESSLQPPTFTGAIDPLQA